MGTIRRPGRKIWWTMRIVIAVICVPFLFIAWDQATYNFGTVQHGHICRSGQMPEACARSNHSRTSHQDGLESARLQSGRRLVS